MEEENKKCPHCTGWGYHAPETKEPLHERMYLAVPCFVCEGTGTKGGPQLRQSCIGKVNVISTEPVLLDPDTFCPHRKISLEFNIRYDDGSDTRPPSRSWSQAIRAFQIGKEILKALESKGVYI
jgi:hypothetical protein